MLVVVVVVVVVVVTLMIQSGMFKRVQPGAANFSSQPLSCMYGPGVVVVVVDVTVVVVSLFVVVVVVVVVVVAVVVVVVVVVLVVTLPSVAAAGLATEGGRIGRGGEGWQVWLTGNSSQKPKSTFNLTSTMSRIPRWNSM